jgi:hypothetical protein
MDEYRSGQEAAQLQMAQQRAARLAREAGALADPGAKLKPGGKAKR